MSVGTRGLAASLAAALLLVASMSTGAAEPLQVTVGYQTNVTPAQAAIPEQAYEKASGAAIDWRKFDSGSDVIAAMASGDVQIGYAGSSPATTAFSKHHPFEVFYVAQLIAADEALVVRNHGGIGKPAGLVGGRSRRRSSRPRITPCSEHCGTGASIRRPCRS